MDKPKRSCCPECGKRIVVVALARDYVIYGCVEHREYDEVIDL